MRTYDTRLTPRPSFRADRHSRFAALSATALLAVVLLPAGAGAKVKVTTRADGTKVIYDESESQYGRRTAGSLSAVPQSYISDLIDYYSRDRGLSPKLVQAVIQVESGYNAKALSNRGAMGLMQLMPDTAKQLRVSDPYDPGQNIRGGTLYLRRQLDRFSGDVTLALAAYNAGPTAVSQHGGVPPYNETRNYVRKVLGLYRGVPVALKEHARDQARKRAEAERQADAQQPGGGKVYMSRGKNNRIVFTSAPPKTH